MSNRLSSVSHLSFCLPTSSVCSKSTSSTLVCQKPVCARREWSPELKEIVARNWIVKLVGRRGHLITVDELQEEGVRNMKILHNPGG